MIADRPGDADTTRWTFGLKSGRYIHAVAMQVRPIGNHITDVDPDTKANSPIRGLIVIVIRHMLLDIDRAAHCPAMLSNTMSKESPPVERYSRHVR